MSERIYEVVVNYIKSQNAKWRFVFGSKVYTKDELLKKMEEDKKFREFVIEEVVKTAVDLFIRR
ncbi:MAG: hypothetical protein QW407_02660 [Thermofilaceae archaeon]